MNTDMSCNMLADLHAVKTLKNYVPYQRSQFSLLAKLLVTAPRPPVESLAEEAQHYWHCIWANGLSEETGKAKPLTLWRDETAISWSWLSHRGHPSPSWLSSLKFKFSSLCTLPVSGLWSTQLPWTLTSTAEVRNEKQPEISFQRVIDCRPAPISQWQWHAFGATPWSPDLQTDGMCQLERALSCL